MPTKKQNGKSVNKIKTRRRAVNVRRKCQDGGVDLKDLWRKMRMEKWLRNNRVVPLVVMTESDINALYAERPEATASAIMPARPTIRPTRPAFAAVAESNATTCADLPQDVLNIITYQLDSDSVANLASSSQAMRTLVQKNFKIVKLTQNVQYGHDTILLMIARIFNKINTKTTITLGNKTFYFTLEQGTQITIKVVEREGVEDILGMYDANTYYANVLRDAMANKVTISNLTLPMLNTFFEQASVKPHINNTDIIELRELVYNQTELTQHPAILSIVKSQLNDPEKQQCEKHKDVIVAIPSSLFDALKDLGINNSFDYLISMLYYLDTREKTNENENYGMATHCFKQLIRLKHKANVNELLKLDVTDDSTRGTRATTEQNYEKMEQFIVKKINNETQYVVKQMRFCLLHICNTIYSQYEQRNDTLNYIIILSRFFNYALTSISEGDPLSNFIRELHEKTITNNPNVVLPFIKDIKIKDKLYSYIIGDANTSFWTKIIIIGDAITIAAGNHNQVNDIQTDDPYTFTPKQFIEGIHIDLVVDTEFEDYDRIKNLGDIFIYMNDAYINNAMKGIKFETQANLLEVTYKGVEEHLKSTDPFDKFIDSAITFDRTTMHILFPNFCRQPVNNGGGKKPTAYKKTDMRYEYNGRNRIVYVGKRGGKYIQIKNKMTPVSKLN